MQPGRVGQAAGPSFEVRSRVAIAAVLVYGRGMTKRGQDQLEGPPRNLHDGFFKAVFGDPRLAAEELRAVLPAEVGAHIDWSTMVPAPAGFVNEVFRQRLSDLVFHAGLVDGGETLLWFMVEHQSTEDWWMIERVVDTETRMWRGWRRLHPEERRLPPVVPVVVYHGARPWKAPTSMEELYALPGEASAALSGYVLARRMVVDDLCAIGDDALRARRMDAFARLCLFAMARGAAEDFLDRLVRDWRAELRLVLAAEDRERAALFLRYTVHVNPHAEPETLRERLVPAVGEEAEEVIVTVAEKLIQQGVEQGIEQGIEQGQRGLLLRLLEKRFGALPEVVTARVSRAGAADLERWFEGALDAASLDEVFRSS